MSVVTSTLKPSSRGGSFNADQGGFTYQRTYVVRTDDAHDDERAVLDGYLLAGPDPGPDYMAVFIRSDTSAGFPAGIPDLSSRAQRFTLSQPDVMTPTLWEVNVTYTPLRRGQDPTFTQSQLDPTWNPLDRPVEFYIDQQTTTRTIERDFAGNPVANTANQPFDEPAEEDAELEVMIFNKRFATIQECRVLNRRFRRKLNADTFAGYPPGHCLCSPVRVSKAMEENGQRFYEATFKIVCNDRPWRREFVNRGFKHFEDLPDTSEGATEGDTVKTLVIASVPLVVDGVKTYVPASEPVLLAGGPVDATATLSAALSADDRTASISGFVAILPDDEASQPSPLPTEALNPLGLAAAVSASVQLIWNGSAWSITKTPPDDPLPDKPPNRGYRLPDKRGGNVVAIQVNDSVAFTGVNGLPFAAPTDVT